MAKKDVSNAQKLGIGVGLTTAAVAAVGAYFLYGSKDATKNRKKVKSWALKAKGEVLEVLERGGKITEGEFKDLVDGVVKTYAKVEKVSKRELDEFKKEMGDNWKGLISSGVASVYNTDAIAKKIASKMPAKKAAPKKTGAKKTTGTKKTAAKKSAAKKTTS